MKHRVIIFILLLSTVCAFAKVKVLESKPQYILIEYLTDAYKIINNDAYDHIDAPTLSYTSDHGAPLLPFDEIKVAIPPSGSLSFSIISQSFKRHTLSNSLMPAPYVSSDAEGSKYTYTPDPDKYQKAGSAFVEALPYTTFRGYSHVPLVINPFSYDGKRSLQVVDQAIIRIDIMGDVTYRSSQISDPLSDVFLPQLINAEYGKNWRNDLRTEIAHSPWSLSDWWMRIETDKDGFFKLTPAQLSAFPLSDVDPRSFRMFSTGGAVQPNSIVTTGAAFTEIPIRVIGEEDGSFSGSDYIMFYGTNRNGLIKNENIKTRHFVNPYSQNTVFWLTFGGDFGGNPKRIAAPTDIPSWAQQVDYHAQSHRVEEEIHRRKTVGFDWYMTKLFGQSTADYQFSFTLENVQATRPQSLEISLIGEDVNDVINHSMSLFMNGNQIYNSSGADTTRFTWSGAGEFIINRAHNLYVSGQNTLMIRIHRSRTDNLYLNYFVAHHHKSNVKGNTQLQVFVPPTQYLRSVRYDFTGMSSTTEVYKVDDFAGITALRKEASGSGHYFVSNGVASTAFYLVNPADLYVPPLIQLYTPQDITANPAQIDNVILCPAEFYDSAVELSQFYWDTYRIRSMVLKQQDVFDQFNGGHPDPSAIKQVVRYLYHHYPAPKLSSMTILGIGSIDWRNFSQQAADKNRVMVYQKGEVVSEDYLGMISTPNYPEIAIGRYPVKNQNELNLMLTNMRQYVQNPSPGLWQNTVLMVADDLANGNITGEYIHTQQAQAATDNVVRGVLTEKVLGMEYDYDEFQNKPKARDDIFRHINDGVLMWYYIGHGSYDKLGAEDYLNGATDMNRFANQGKPNLFLAASCTVGHFDYWGYESLAQKMVLLNNMGSIAAYAATRETYPYQNAPLMNSTVDHAINKRNPIGYSVLVAKIGYTQSNSNDEKYLIMGDPLLRIVPPQRDSSLVISIDGIGADTLYSRQLAEVSGSFPETLSSSVVQTYVFDADNEYTLGWGTNISRRGSTIFRGSTTVNPSGFASRFIVPDDVRGGNTASALAYYWDSNAKKAYVKYKFPFGISDQAIVSENPDAPVIELYLGSWDFREGDTVGTNTTLYARISDQNGINLTGSPGHNILLILDGTSQPISVTQYFEYDPDSYTHGTLIYPLSGLSEGPHTLQLIAFDNRNRPAVQNTAFMVKKSSELSIERLLPYPNPMKNETHFTFILSEEAELDIAIFTMSGRRIRRIKSTGKKGFNSIRWDGRDADGDRIANNTYFVRVRAKAAGKKSVEKTERIVVYN